MCKKYKINLILLINGNQLNMKSLVKFETFKIVNDEAVSGGGFSFNNYGGWSGGSYSGWNFNSYSSWGTSASNSINISTSNGVDGADGADGVSGSISIAMHQSAYQQPIYHQPVQPTTSWGSWGQSLLSNFWWCI